LGSKLHIRGVVLLLLNPMCVASRSFQAFACLLEASRHVDPPRASPPTLPFPFLPLGTRLRR
jgi:hypothetical protein